MSKSHFHRSWNFLDCGLHFGGYLVGESHTKVDMWLILGVQAGKVGLTAGWLVGSCKAAWPQGPQDLRQYGQMGGTQWFGGYGNYQKQVTKIPNYQNTKVQRYQVTKLPRLPRLPSYQGYQVTKLPLIPRSLVAPTRGAGGYIYIYIYSLYRKSCRNDG